VCAAIGVSPAPMKKSTKAACSLLWSRRKAAIFILVVADEATVLFITNEHHL